MILHSPRPEVVGSWDYERAESLAAKHMRALEKKGRSEEFSHELVGISTWRLPQRLRLTHSMGSVLLGAERYEFGRTQEHREAPASQWHIDGQSANDTLIDAHDFLIAVSCMPTEYLVGDIPLTDGRMIFPSNGSRGLAYELRAHGINLRGNRTQAEINSLIDDEIVEKVTFDPGDIVYVPRGNLHRVNQTMPLNELPEYRLIFYQMFMDVSGPRR